MKLDKFTKAERKSLIHHFGKALKIRTVKHITFAFIKTSPNRGKLAWSIHSESDGKFRRKFGEYVALERLYDGGMPVEFYDIDCPDAFEQWLYDFAQEISAFIE